MSIRNEVMPGRNPSIGSITVGRTTVSKSGKTIPTRTKTAVFHVNDGEVANAVLEKFGGKVHSDSDTYEFDIEIEDSDIDCFVLPATFRQNLELWRAAECLRRCDGVTMSVADGQRVMNKPCVCDQGNRDCKPSTSLAVLIDLGIDRYAPWYVKSNAWSTAASLKGSVESMLAAGLDGLVPAVLQTRPTKVRTPDDKVVEHAEFQLAVKVALSDLPLLGSRPVSASVSAGDTPPSLPPSSTGNALPDSAQDAERRSLTDRWRTVGDLATDEQMESLRGAFVERHGDTKTADLPLDALRAWVDYAESQVVAAQ